MGLQGEIDLGRQDIRTEEYAMSIGEWISMYEKNELDIHPEFQRFYRWTDQQKSRLIESILLGIPVPPIFVAQKSDGTWDVVDGLQRLATIFECAGILKDEAGRTLPMLPLQRTKYLPSLEGLTWENARHPDKALDATQRLLIKRARLGASIILRESDPHSKYELFQRLNTGGSPLSDQEVRNAILLSVNSTMFRWLKKLSDMTVFSNTVALTDRAIDEQYDMELVLRFIVFRQLDERHFVRLTDLGDFLTDRMMELAMARAFAYKSHETAFVSTFKLLNSALGPNAFRRYDRRLKRFSGGFLVSAFEAVALGTGYNIKQMQVLSPLIVDKVQRLWGEQEFLGNIGSGVSASSRVPKIVPFSRRYFAV
jgi:hypothetical protein